MFSQLCVHRGAGGLSLSPCPFMGASVVPGPFQGVGGYPGGRYSPPDGDIEGVGMSRGVGTRPRGLGMSRVVGIIFPYG